MAEISVRNISFYHGKGTPYEIKALDDVSLDIKHGLIGAGVYASHGYERSHKDGVRNTILVLKGYLGI